MVEYALSRSLSPALIAEYQTQLPDKKLLEAKLHELYALRQNRSQWTQTGQTAADLDMGRIQLIQGLSRLHQAEPAIPSAARICLDSEMA